MKHQKNILILITLSILTLSSCTVSTHGSKKKDPTSHTIVLSDESVELNLKSINSKKLTAVVDNDDHSSLNVLWEVSDIDVISYSSSTSLVSGKNEGVAIVKAYLEKYPQITANCEVRVINKTPTYESISVSTDSLELDCKNNEEKEFTYSVNGSDLPSQDVTYSLSPSSIAQITLTDHKFVVKALSEGDGTLKITSSGNPNISKKVSIAVRDSSPITVSLEKPAEEVKQGRTLQLKAIINKKINNGVSWKSSNHEIEIDEYGLISCPTTVAVGTKTTITATSNDDPTKYATCIVTVTEKPEFNFDYTIMYYISGSNLENENSVYTQELMEILRTKMPSNIKVIVQTGGSLSWHTPQTILSGATEISAKNVQRWEAVNGKLTYLDTLETNHQADENTFEDFLEWGLANYSASKMAVVLMGHGGGVAGCQYDDNYYNNSLSTDEICRALKSSFNKYQRDKFSWIGYYNCLMGCADIATACSDYFEYMLASQEVQLATTWQHSYYLNKIKSNPEIDTKTMLCDFAKQTIKTIHTTYCPYYSSCDETLSVYDLSKANSFADSFNKYCTEIGMNSETYELCGDIFKSSNVHKFQEEYGLADFEQFINQLSLNFPDISISSTISCLKTMVIENSYCAKYNPQPCGLNIFYPVSVSKDYFLQVSYTDYMNPESTKLYEWQSMCLENGSWAF